MANIKIIDEIFETFRQRGHQAYGEAVTQLEHALQTAYFAERDGADALLVAAALLHDYGHLIHDLPEEIADQEIDAIHEQVGADFLARYFIPAVVEPGRLHVAAKRYLCAVDIDYANDLSPASIQSLQLQGGPFNDAEIKAFEASPYFRAAMQLRLYDDQGKIPGLDVPDLEHYRACLEAALKPE